MISTIAFLTGHYLPRAHDCLPLSLQRPLCGDLRRRGHRRSGRHCGATCARGVRGIAPSPRLAGALETPSLSTVVVVFVALLIVVPSVVPEVVDDGVAWISTGVEIAALPSTAAPLSRSAGVGTALSEIGRAHV